MIYIKDDFLNQELFDLLKESVHEFKKVDTPGKSFWVHLAEEHLIKYVSIKLGEIENCKIENVLAFFREAKQGQDNDWRIHNDTIINDQQPDRAVVLYMSPTNTKLLNGTAFWKHKKYGDTYPKDKETKEFNRMLKEDSNDIDKWELKTIIGHKENRLISYPCEYFHSKYPNEFQSSRIVFVMFYKIK